MLSSFEKGRPEMPVTGDAYHWGMTVGWYILQFVRKWFAESVIAPVKMDQCT